jgi:hypothetical protein
MKFAGSQALLSTKEEHLICFTQQAGCLRAHTQSTALSGVGGSWPQSFAGTGPAWIEEVITKQSMPISNEVGPYLQQG